MAAAARDRRGDRVPRVAGEHAHLRGGGPGVRPPVTVALDDDAAIAKALEELAIAERPRDTYRAGDEIHLELDKRRIVIIGEQVTEQGREDRWFFRLANWLHYNRGKKAWTYVADAYAVLLLYLACSGLFMLKGRLGMRWRGTLLVGLGVAVPITYVAWSGGPSGHQPSPSAERASPPVAGDDAPP